MLLKRGEEEEFLGVQLVGGDDAQLHTAVEVLNDYEFDVLDFNLGCPVPKIAKRGAGAALGCDVERALRLFFGICRRSRHRLSAKIRILSETDPEPTVRLVRGLYEMGACAVTIHGRMPQAFFSGSVHYEIIRSVVDAVPIQIIGNGGIMNAETAKEMRRCCNCGPVMVARGAMGNPWLFQEIASDGKFMAPTLSELLNEIEAHVRDMTCFYGEKVAMRLARKIVHDYLRGRGFPGEIRNRASFLNTFEDLQLLLSAASSARVKYADRVRDGSILRERRLRYV